jgi:hypothetical protein
VSIWYALQSNTLHILTTSSSSIDMQLGMRIHSQCCSMPLLCQLLRLQGNVNVNMASQASNDWAEVRKLKQLQRRLHSECVTGYQ